MTLLATFDPVWEPKLDPIRNYQTVSLGSTLAIWLSGRAHHSRVPRMPVRLFAGWSPAPTRKNSPSFKDHNHLLAVGGGPAHTLPKGHP